MKKTLFLSAILGAALCSSAFAEKQTATISQSADQVNLSQYGSNYIVTLNVTQPSSGNSAYLEGQNASTVAFNADLVIESLYLNNGWSKDNLNYLFKGTITGSGNITRTANQGGQIFNFSGDMSKYTGTISMEGGGTGNRTNRLVLTGNTVGGATLNTTGTAQFETDGEVTLDGTTVSAAYAYIRNNSTLLLTNNTNATLSNLTIGSGAAINVGEGSSLDLTVGRDWTATDERARTEGNGWGLGKTTLTRNFGSAIVNNGGTITVGGNDATMADGVLSATSSSSKVYYINNGSAAINFTGAVALVVGDTTVSLTSGVNSLNSLTINGGSENTVTMGGGDSFYGLLTINSGKASLTGSEKFVGDIVVKNGTLSIAQTDAVNYHGTAEQKTITIGAGGVLDFGTNRLSIGNAGSAGLKVYEIHLEDGGKIQGDGDGNRALHYFDSGKIVATGTGNSITATTKVRDAADTLTYEVEDGSDLTVSGLIEGPGKISKTGTGILTLSGENNTYTGGTTISAGKLIATKKASLGTGSINVATGATLTIDETITALTASGAGTVTAGTAAGTNVTINGGEDGFSGKLTLAAAAADTHDTKVQLSNFSGTLALSGRYDLTESNLTGAAKIVLNGDRSGNTTTGFWAHKNSGADIINASVELTGENIISIFNNGNLTFEKAVSSSSTGIKAEREHDMTFNGTVKLQSYTHAGSYATKTTFNAASTLGSLSATVGSIVVNDSLTVTGGATSIKSLTLGSGASITLGSALSHDCDLTTSTLTVAGNATMNANLVVNNNGTMDFSNHTELTMGCTVTIGDHVTIKIDDSELASIVNTGAVMTIIKDVEGVDMNNLALTLGSDWRFVDAQGNSLDAYNLRLDVVDAGDGKVNIVVAPEPATATLSLLALAGLCARRKRH